jgi:hypothetical protein
MTQKLRVKQLVAFANSLELHVDLDKGDPSYTPHKRKWKGTISLVVNMRTLVSKPETLARILGAQLAHELGHYIVAPKSRRRLKDYGIPSASSAPYWLLDEAKARVVEHHLRRHFGDSHAMKDPLRLSRFSRTRKAIAVWWRDTGRATVEQELNLFRSKRKRTTHLL